MCGEHRQRLGRSLGSEGSSPRVRGTLLYGEATTKTIGIIPACAGNTFRILSTYHVARDHPRVCGEHCGFAYAGISVTGSSPRVRGTRVQGRGVGLGRGIIPACAGNTERRHEHRPADGDHPRVCGEHGGDVKAKPTAPGSSPRVRGTQCIPKTAHHIFGIIPACAGNTTLARHSIVQARDHPRVCGEHVLTCGVMCGTWGSSPRVRGTLNRLWPQLNVWGIIPACAGNTQVAVHYAEV